MIPDITVSPNVAATKIWTKAAARSSARIGQHTIGGATVFDFGVEVDGSIAAGLKLAQGCLGGDAQVTLSSTGDVSFGVSNLVSVMTDGPETACLGCQYAGWPVQTDDYFAMGSGPMRLLRGKEPVLVKRELADLQTSVAAGVLESDQLPSDQAIESVASECGVNPSQLTLAVAPSTSIAGTIQVVARSVETAMHQLFEREFDLGAVISATGNAPLPPVARRGDTIGGIGRTNDAILYGANVTFWVDCEDSVIDAVVGRITSSASKDYGRPFAKIFADYDHDFYKVDPGLFSPAVVIFHNVRSGNTFTHGTMRNDLVRESFGT